MRRNTRPRLENVVVALAILVILADAVGIWFLLRKRREQPPAPTEPVTEAPTEAPTEPALSGPEFFLPEHLAFGEKLPVTTFQNGAGETVDLLEAYPGERLVLMYWGSWCPYCDEQLEQLENLAELAAAEDARLILVNKTDAAKEETIQKGEQYLADKGWLQYDHVYDTDLNAYRAYGMKRIPTTIMVDGDGYVRGTVSSVLDGATFAAFLERALYGNAKQQLAFLENHMMNAAGGVYTAFRNSSGTSPKGHDVLSESMGLLMCCAVQLENKNLFDRCWNYLTETMQRDGLFAWYAAENGTQGTSNALLDDLRIARALNEANEKWGGYDAALTSLAEGILEKNTYQNRLCSFYDFRQKKSGSTISLTYGDFETLDWLAEIQPAFVTLREDLLQTVQNGFIGVDFPLYYATYDYKTRAYSTDSLNTAEALLTVYHLSEIGLAREETLNWLKNALQNGTLAARYQVDGTVEPGYQYDSTAVFAIAALIGQRTGDGELYRLARSAMERTYVSDTESFFCGAFTQGGDLQAFDQLLPLTVYAGSGDAKF